VPRHLPHNPRPSSHQDHLLLPHPALHLCGCGLHLHERRENAAITLLMYTAHIFSAADKAVSLFECVIFWTRGAAQSQK
jgi:hypothetical protein